MATLFDLLARLTYWGLTVYEWIIIIAILLSWVNPDPRNPIVQFLNNMTVPVWNRVAASLPVSLRLFAAYFALLLVWFLKIFAPGVLATLSALMAGRLDSGGVVVRVAGFFLLGVGIVLQNLLFFLILLLLVWFFLSLVNPSVNNPIVRTLYVLVDPFITPLQRRLPRYRIDISPLVAAALFLLLNVFVVSELVSFAIGLTNGGLVHLPTRTI